MTAPEQELPVDLHQPLMPGTEPWLRLMTASKVAAILGVSQYDSPRSMWHKMRNELPKPAETPVQSRGHYLEEAIVNWWCDQHPEFPRDLVDRQPEFKMSDWAAATPDGAVQERDENDVWTGRYVALVEAKSARDLDEWGLPGTDEIPIRYLVQCWWQMHVSGVHICYVPILGTFLDFTEYVIRYDAEIGAQLEQRCRDFYASLAADKPPPIDGTTSTYDALRTLYRSIDEVRTVEIEPAVAREYIDAAAEKKAAEARERQAKATVLDLMGDAKYAECVGIRVARRQANKTGFQLNQVAKTTDLIPNEGTSHVQ